MTMPNHCPPNHPRVREIALVARQETIPPIGAQPTIDRPVGVASVILTLENPVDAKHDVILQRVDVVSTDTREVLFSQSSSQTISLLPLEHRCMDMRLTNQIGYPNTNQVVAIATYCIPDSTSITEYTITSALTRVGRSPDI